MTKHHDQIIARKMQYEKMKERRKRRIANRKNNVPIQVPHTIETLRVPDVTMVETVIYPDINLEQDNTKARITSSDAYLPSTSAGITVVDPEVLKDEESDEFADLFSGAKQSKVLITVATKVKPRTVNFCKELAEVIPNSRFYQRHRLPLKQICKKAATMGFTSMLVFNEDVKKINGLVLINLPNGPTAHFKVSNARPRSEIKATKGCGSIEQHVIPQVNVKHFGTRLGRRIGRMFKSLLPHTDPGKVCVDRRLITFHNQRDFIFFRHHRYEFRETVHSKTKKKMTKVALKELGPRMTLKLRSLQAGTFDSSFGDYEFVHKRHEQETSRRKFFL